MGILKNLAQKASANTMDLSKGESEPKLSGADYGGMYGLKNDTVGIEARSIPNATLIEGVVNGDLIVNGTISSKSLKIGEQTFISTVDFTTDYPDYASWTSGQISTIGGNPITINSGNTGRLQAITSAYTVEASTLALWHLNETSGTTLDNAEGDTSWDMTLSSGTVNQTGKFDKCVLLNGTSNYASVADYSEMDQTDFTWQGWFKTDGTFSSQRYLISRSYTSASATARYVDIYVTSTGFLECVAYGYNSIDVVYIPYILSSTSRVDDSAWHNFLFNFSGTNDTAQLYVDGILQDSKTNCIYNPRASAQAIYVGKSDLASPGYFKGYLDEIRFSNTNLTLSAAAIRFIYYDALVGANLQVTTDRNDLISDNRILLCTMTPQLSGTGAYIVLERHEGTTITGDKIKTGRIESSDGRTYFDLDQRRLVVNDGSTDRILIGYLE